MGADPFLSHVLVNADVLSVLGFILNFICDDKTYWLLFALGFWCFNQLSYFLHQFNQDLVMITHTFFKLIDFPRQFFICQQHFTKSNEVTDYKDTHFVCLRWIQHICRLQGSVLRENKCKFSSATPAGTWCRNLRFQVFEFFFGQLKHKIIGKFINVAADLFI